MMNRIVIASCGLALLVSSPALAKKDPQLTPMEIQALQSHEYSTTKEILFASAVSVFQDLGYQLENADLPSGFITASSATNNKTNILEAFGGVSSSGNTRVTAFVEQIVPGRAKIRLNFLNTKSRSGLYGQTAKSDKPILDPKTYQVAWDKIDEGVFMRSASTSSNPSTKLNDSTTVGSPAIGLPSVGPSSSRAPTSHQ